MKKSICLLLAITTIFSLSACSKKEQVKQENVEVQQVTGEAFYKTNENFDLDELINVKIGEIIPLSDEESVMAFFTFTNKSNKNLDISRFQGLRVYVGDTANMNNNGCFELSSVENRRDYINNDGFEKNHLLKPGGKMMVLYNWSFILPPNTTLKDLFSENEEFLKNSKELTIEVKPWYVEGDISTEKKENVKFFVDFQNIYKEFAGKIFPVAQ